MGNNKTSPLNDLNTETGMTTLCSNTTPSPCHIKRVLNTIIEAYKEKDDRNVKCLEARKQIIQREPDFTGATEHPAGKNRDRVVITVQQVKEEIINLSIPSTVDCKDPSLKFLYNLCDSTLQMIMKKTKIPREVEILTMRNEECSDIRKDGTLPKQETSTEKVAPINIHYSARKADNNGVYALMSQNHSSSNIQHAVQRILRNRITIDSIWRDIYDSDTSLPGLPNGAMKNVKRIVRILNRSQNEFDSILTTRRL